MIWVLVPVLIAATGLASLRWLRVAQREHYLAPSVTRFAWRWWTTGPLNQILGLAAAGGAILSFFLDPSLSWLALAAAVGPIGLSLRGRTSSLAWTPRLKRLAGLTGVFALVLAAWALLIRLPGPSAVGLVALPRLVDASAAILARLEQSLGDRFVDQARRSLATAGAVVVGITGSYGKTTTKAYLAHLLRDTKSVVATPASFNNRMGLARAINEQLTPGTEVFIAEMGTYGRGEIRQLCEFVPPRVAIITALGPVHLERFGNEESILAAKSEILERAAVAVISIDHPLLSGLAEEAKGRMRTITVSAVDPSAEVAVIEGVVTVMGRGIGSIGEGSFPINAGCAVGAALGLGIDEAHIGKRLADLPGAAHRRQVSRNGQGVHIIDDTYNSNPAGARAALASLLSIPGNGRKVVVTPGMVELGSRQYEENREWASTAADQTTDLVVVGQTNKSALLDGAKGRRAIVTVVGARNQAVEWVRQNLEAGDAVLYENDLPDHYP